MLHVYRLPNRRLWSARNVWRLMAIFQFWVFNSYVGSFRVKEAQMPPTSCPVASKYLSWTHWDSPDRSPNDCELQLSNNIPMTRITLRRYSSTGSYLKIITTWSGGTTCMSLAMTAMVEVNSGEETVTLHECRMESEGGSGAVDLTCVHWCQCDGPCPRVHLQFHSLQAIGINNLDWSLCNIQMCVLSGSDNNPIVQYTHGMFNTIPDQRGGNNMNSISYTNSRN